VGGGYFGRCNAMYWVEMISDAASSRRKTLRIREVHIAASLEG
jgi:hypothetical protein